MPPPPPPPQGARRSTRQLLVYLYGSSTAFKDGAALQQLALHVTALVALQGGMAAAAAAAGEGGATAVAAEGCAPTLDAWRATCELSLVLAGLQGAAHAHPGMWTCYCHTRPELLPLLAAGCLAWPEVRGGGGGEGQLCGGGGQGAGV